MVIKITPTQSSKVKELVRSHCCNFSDGNCLLLDDGDAHSCVQNISYSGIFCNYFKNNVLPNDTSLYTEIMNPSTSKKCVCCGSFFIPITNNQKYCSNCAKAQTQKRKREYNRRRRAIKRRHSDT